MNKYYKNTTGHQISMALFGVGEISIPANAACVELDPGVVHAINQMVSPSVVLEEVTPKITAEEDVIAPRKRSRKPAETVEDDLAEAVDELEAESAAIEEEKLEDINL